MSLIAHKTHMRLEKITHDMCNYTSGGKTGNDVCEIFNSKERGNWTYQGFLQHFGKNKDFEIKCFKTSKRRQAKRHFKF